MNLYSMSKNVREFPITSSLNRVIQKNIYVVDTLPSTIFNQSFSWALYEAQALPSLRFFEIIIIKDNDAYIFTNNF